MNFLRIRKARVWPQKHRSGNTTWKVFVGDRTDGKKEIHSFALEAEAKHFAQDWNAKLISKHSEGLSDLGNLARTELLAAQAKAVAYGATLPEAVDFFIKYARPEKGKVKVEEAVKYFLEAKEHLQRRESYISNYRKTYLMPFARAHPNSVVSEVTQAQAERYLNSHKKWNSTSKASHISYLRTFYEFLIKKGYAKLNPFKHIEKPNKAATKPKMLSPQHAKQLLQFAFDEGSQSECAAMVLIFFCGARVEEVRRLTWDKIDLETRKLEITEAASKIGKRRVNDIPPNAYEWLTLCKGQGSVAPNDFLQRMKRLRRRAEIPYPQNAMRHSFAAYHISKFRNAPNTAILLGHTNPSMLYNTYYELAKATDADAFWDIIPDIVVLARQTEATARDHKAREEAEEHSNCGQAVRDGGSWVPVQAEMFQQSLDE